MENLRHTPIEEGTVYLRTNHGNQPKVPVGWSDNPPEPPNPLYKWTSERTFKPISVEIKMVRKWYWLWLKKVRMEFPQYWSKPILIDSGGWTEHPPVEKESRFIAEKRERLVHPRDWKWLWLKRKTVMETYWHYEEVGNVEKLEIEFNQVAKG